MQAEKSSATGSSDGRRTHEGEDKEKEIDDA